MADGLAATPPEAPGADRTAAARAMVLCDACGAEGFARGPGERLACVLCAACGGTGMVPRGGASADA